MIGKMRYMSKGILKNNFKYFKLILSFVVSIAFHPEIFAALEDWKVVLFAGPGKGGEKFLSAMASNWKNEDELRVYGLCFNITDFNKTLPIGSGRIYEYYWNNGQWNNSISETPEVAMDIMPFKMCFYDKDGNSVPELYLTSFNNSFTYEYYLDGNLWKGDYINADDKTDAITTSVIGKGRNNDNKTYMYKATTHGQFTEYSFNGQSWILENACNFEKMSYMIGGKIEEVYENTLSISFAKKDNKTYTYITIFNSSKIHELYFNGSSWIKTSEININICDKSVFGRPWLFSADYGNSENIYCLDDRYGIAELSWKNDRWRIKGVTKINEEPINSYIAITNGAISKEDPPSIYALVYSTADYSVNFSKDIADKICEYTFGYDEKSGKWKWQKTYEVKLYEENMNTNGIKRIVANFGEIYMVNGRNEKEVDAQGNVTDKYKRLYITDTWGNIWECSVPPREERLPDPTGFNYGRNKPGSGTQRNPGDPKKPSIMGN